MWRVFAAAHWTCQWKRCTSFGNYTWRYKASSRGEISLFDMGCQSVRLNTRSRAETNSSSDPGSQGPWIIGLVLNFKDSICNFRQLSSLIWKNLQRMCSFWFSIFVCVFAFLSYNNNCCCNLVMLLLFLFWSCMLFF